MVIQKPATIILLTILQMHFFCTWQNVEFNWEDTTGSVNLISNGLANFPFTAGTISNGCFRLPDVFPGGNKFKFFGTCYDTIVISTNGIIGLGGSLDEMITSNPVQIPSVLAAPKPAIFPFWYACNFQDPDVAGRNLKYKLSGNKLIITFARVPAYNTVYDSSDYLSYQVILETGDDCSSDNGKIKVQFDNDKSGSTFLNNYINGNLSTGLVGIQNADGTLGIQYRYSNSNTPGYLFFHNQWGTSPIAVEFGQINELLPVELESFTSSVIENNVNLIWRVNSEINNAGFDIERSGVKGQTSNEWIKTGFVNGKGTATYSQLYSFEDKNLSSGKYKYRLKQIDFNGSFKYYDLQNEVVVGVPVRFNLSQNYPNPFNPATKIKFEIPVDSKVMLKIYDNIGREMKTLVNEFKSAGYYTVDFNGSNFSSGVYFYKITAGDFSEVKKMTLLK
ncbi:MAG: T9SS type A sorting domain-containing protein [Ignavibacteria bacterium]|nr:T9SS type A sorting domain-containing protein [Ignavibacteria bacterium]